MQGDEGKALLRDRGNESLRRRLSEGAPPRGGHAGDGFIVGGSCSRADSWLGSALLVAKSGGKEVSHIEKNNDLSEKEVMTVVLGLCSRWVHGFMFRFTSRAFRFLRNSSATSL